jgi:single-strand DNA-binding protein
MAHQSGKQESSNEPAVTINNGVKNMQIITIDGNVGKDGQTRQVREQSVFSFPVAVKQGWGDNTKTNWYRVNVWGKRAETLSQMVGKGSKVVVVGELSIGEWEGKPQYDIRASEVVLMSGGQKPQQAPQQTKQPAYQDDMDDSIPF